MIRVSQAYKDTMVAGKRKFNAIITIILEDGTILSDITNANLRSFSMDDAVSDDNKFTMLGSAVINQLVIALDDMYDNYYSYNFYGAIVIVYIDCYLLDNTIERLRKGTFFVDEYRYLDGITELTCFDYLAKFDRPYSISSLEYPASINDIVTDACNICGVELSNSEIEYGDLIVSNRPSDESNFREVLGWVAQIIGCYAKCDRFGRLTFNWCDIDVLNNSYGSLDGGVFDADTSTYLSGDDADGGLFNPWNTGYVMASASFAIQEEAHNFYYNYSQEIAVSDITITGVTVIADPPPLMLDSQYNMMLGLSNGCLILQRTDDAPADFYLNTNDSLVAKVYNKKQNEYKFSLNNEGSVICETAKSIDLPEEELVSKTFSVGNEGFVVTVENNNLITEKTGEEIANRLSKKLIGMRFRKATTSHMNDPSIESGDIAVLWDRKNRAHPIIVTHTIFKISGQQRTVCGAESGARNTATRYSNTTKAYLKLTGDIQTEQTLRQQDVENLTTTLMNLPAMYGTSDINNDIYYLHNKKSLSESDIIWRVNKDGIAISTTGGNSWYAGLSLNYERGSAVISQEGVVRIIPKKLPKNIGANYSVMLQKLGQGDLWITNKNNTYFNVVGTENLMFDWEIKW